MIRKLNGVVALVFNYYGLFMVKNFDGIIFSIPEIGLEPISLLFIKLKNIRLANAIWIAQSPKPKSGTDTLAFSNP